MASQEEILEAIDETIVKWTRALKLAQRREKTKALVLVKYTRCHLCRLSHDQCRLCIVYFYKGYWCLKDYDVRQVLSVSAKPVSSKELALHIGNVLEKLKELKEEFVKSRTYTLPF